jgi:hypothetical protein
VQGVGGGVAIADVELEHRGPGAVATVRCAQTSVPSSDSMPRSSETSARTYAPAWRPRSFRNVRR